MPAGRPKLKPRTFTAEEKKEILDTLPERWEKFKQDRHASAKLTQNYMDRVSNKLNRPEKRE